MDEIMDGPNLPNENPCKDIPMGGEIERTKEEQVVHSMKELILAEALRTLLVPGSGVIFDSMGERLCIAMDDKRSLAVLDNTMVGENLNEFNLGFVKFNSITVGVDMAKEGEDKSVEVTKEV